MMDTKTMSEKELNETVQLLTTKKHFETAAELITEWCFWEDVKKQLGVSQVEDPQDDDITGKEIGRGNMVAEMSARLVEEFDQWGPNVGKDDHA